MAKLAIQAEPYSLIDLMIYMANEKFIDAHKELLKAEIYALNELFSQSTLSDESLEKIVDEYKKKIGNSPIELTATDTQMNDFYEIAKRIKEDDYGQKVLENLQKGYRN